MFNDMQKYAYKVGFSFSDIAKLLSNYDFSKEYKIKMLDFQTINPIVRYWYRY